MKESDGRSEENIRNGETTEKGEVDKREFPPILLIRLRRLIRRRVKRLENEGRNGEGEGEGGEKKDKDRSHSILSERYANLCFSLGIEGHALLIDNDNSHQSANPGLPMGRNYLRYE